MNHHSQKRGSEMASRAEKRKRLSSNYALYVERI